MTGPRGLPPPFLLEVAGALGAGAVVVWWFRGWPTAVRRLQSM